MIEQSTTRRPATPCTRQRASVTEVMGSVPIEQVPVPCRPGSIMLRSSAASASSSCTALPGIRSVPTKGASAGAAAKRRRVRNSSSAFSRSHGSAHMAQSTSGAVRKSGEVRVTVPRLFGRR